MNHIIRYETTKDISDKDLRPLYTSVGWSSYTEQIDDLNELLQNSQLVISAWSDNTLVGLVRTIGDGLSIQYVQDLLVHPDFQKQAIGTTLFNEVKERSSHIRQFLLITDNGDENQGIIKWYEENGMMPLSDANIIALWRK